MALIHQQGGGTGFDFSELRPKGDIVASTAGVASGPISFMRVFDVSTDVVKQGGKRRGANMGVMHVWHPDIRDFIRSKSGELKDAHLQNFNISVGVYDYFMKAVEAGGQVPLINPRKTKIPNTEWDYYIVKARGYMNEEWIQEEILSELEEKNWSIWLDESKIITIDEALIIAVFR
jgi:ribonucleoside-diphosphate reductase alpha chain